MSITPVIDARPKLTISPRPKGVAFTLETDLGVLHPQATLVLRWIEVVILFLVLVLASLVVTYRVQIAQSPVFRAAAAHAEEAAVVIAVVSLLTGFALAVWKRRQLFTYGIAEIVFGIFSAFQITLNVWPKGELSAFIGIASALYVVSRGAGNLLDALAAEAGVFDRFTMSIPELEQALASGTSHRGE